MKKVLNFALLIAAGFLFASGQWCWGLFALWAWIVNFPHIVTLGCLLAMYFISSKKTR